MSRLKRLKRQQLLLGVVCMAGVMGAWAGGALERVESATIDWRTQLFRKWAKGPSPDVVVMAIDNNVIEEVWPWGREVMAEAIRELDEAEARTIALDVSFDAAWNGEGEVNPDELLASAMREHGRVVLPFRTRERREEAGRVTSVDVLRDTEFRGALERESDEIAARIIVEEVMAQRGVKGDVSEVRGVIPGARTIMALEGRSSIAGGEGNVPGASEVIPPIAPLANAAAALGDVTIRGSAGLDADWVYRRMSLWTPVGEERWWPSFSLAATATFLGARVSEIKAGEDGVLRIPGEPGREVRTGVKTTAGGDAGKRGAAHVLTWPRGGDSWRGQFSGTETGEEREVSIAAALQPYLIQRKTTANLRTLGQLLEVAEGQNLGSYGDVREQLRAMEKMPLTGDAWVQALAAVETGAMRAAAKAAEFIEFAGPVELSELDEENALTSVMYRDVAEKIPGALEECRAAPKAVEESRLRLHRMVNGKLVFIGWVATGTLADSVNTSLGRQTPGVYIHAAAASSYLTGFMRQPAPGWVNVVFVVLLGIGGVWAAQRASVWLAPVLIAGLLGVWVVIAGVGMWDAGWVIAAMSPPALSAATCWLAVLLHRLLVEQRMRRRTEERFRAYVSPAVVDELVNNPGLDSMTPQRRELSIMFCDVTGFTAIAEKLGAEGTAEFLTGYLGKMTDTLLRHSATIDKYLGDGIMAFWGAPIHDPRHARNACRAATALSRAVTEFGERNAQGDGPGPLRIRIGLAAGDVMVGDFGNPPIRSSYTVLGDACNIAARLERACKLLGTTIAVSAGVRAAAGEGFIWRPLGKFVLQGRLTPEPVFELVGTMTIGGARGGDAVLIHDNGGAGRARIDAASVGPWIETTERGVVAFAEGRLEEAREQFEVLRGTYGDELLAEIYLEAIARRLNGEAGDEPADAIVLAEP